ncbi:MAG TPA: hypothetical protein VH249_24900 [Xanthobacteraceae bacterium]|jgi:hypothetical protein|nr:hypothetical protein [Xanthobacteraceae bacterium]
MRTDRVFRSSLVLAAALMTVIPAAAQSQLPRPGQLPPPGPPQAAPQRPQGAPPAGQAQAVAPIKPYKPLAVTLPAPVNDPSFEAFRKQLGDIATRKDRAALAKLLVTQGFFMEGADGNKLDKKKSALDNLAEALGGFAGKDATGWEALSAAALDPTLEPLTERKGVSCGPAGPTIDEQGFEALTKETGTEPGDWAFPVAPNLEVRSAAQPTAPVIEKLGMNLLRVLPDAPPQGNAQQIAPTFARVVTPAGKTGFVAIDGISPIGFDQLCYVKDASGWKITGYESAD